MSETKELPKYKCHKEVWALKIKSIDLVEGDKSKFLLIPEDSRYDPFEVLTTWAVKHDIKKDGYYVVYKDGYCSYSPAEAFEEGYTLAE